MVEIAAGICLTGVGLVLLRIVLARNLDPSANYASRAGQPGEAVLVPAAGQTPGGAATTRGASETSG